jgi:hypothetical protein
MRALDFTRVQKMVDSPRAESGGENAFLEFAIRHSEALVLPFMFRPPVKRR